jgi:hypothetical protein
VLETRNHPLGAAPSFYLAWQQCHRSAYLCYAKSWEFISRLAYLASRQMGQKETEPIPPALPAPAAR